MKTFNETSLRTYYTHNVCSEILDLENHKHEYKNKFIEINMNEIEMILKFS